MKDYEFGYNTKQFERIKTLARSIAGIEIDNSKMDMIYSRLIRIIRYSDFENFSVYVDQLEAENGPYVKEFVNAITTNLTSFFREKHHFNLLVNTALPAVMSQKKKNDRTIRIWSAGCSTGEEPYSIAFTLNDFISTRPGWNFKIYATDIDSNVLAKAKSGVYSLSAVESIQPGDLRRWFFKGHGENAGLCKVKPKFKEDIQFSECNLIEPFNFDQVFDIIFCRNVLIYFDLENQHKILDKFMLRLVKDGFLFTGHSESFMYHYKKTKLISKTMYRKVV